MKIKIILGLLSIIFIISFIKAQPSFINVEFNGNFVNGTTLYSDIYEIDGYVYGKDVYPIKSSVQSIKICENKTINVSQNVCMNKTIVRTIGGNKMNITIKSCSYKKVEKTVTICKTIRIPIICFNNITKVYTNQLSLNNFEYSLDNSTWQQVPYFNYNYSKIYINSTYVLFKVNIPSVCSPEYYINKSIFIE